MVRVSRLGLWSFDRGCFSSLCALGGVASSRRNTSSSRDCFDFFGMGMSFDEERLAFFYALGLAITQWAHVEFELSWILDSCFQPHGKNGALAIIGFRSIENFRSKLQFVDAIVSVERLTKPEKANWENLVKRAQKIANKRNQLAHRFVMDEPDFPVGRRVLLLSMRPARRAAKQKYPGAICLRDVVGYRLEFFALMAALANLRCRLDGQPERFPKSQEQAMPPPTIAQIRREIHAYVSHPPRPLKG